MDHLSWPKPGSHGYVAPGHGLSGRFVPLVTPLTDDGANVSEIRLARLVRNLVNKGAKGLVIASEMGEFVRLTSSERKSILEIVIRESQGAVPVITHVTAFGTSMTLDIAQHAHRHGARAAILAPPPFGKFTEEEMENHVRTIVSYAGLPVIAVDPVQALSESLRARLMQIPALSAGVPLDEGADRELTVEEGVVRADEFASGGLVVSPLLLLGEYTSNHLGLAEALVTHGRTRVAKTLLAFHDIEVGPPRSPMLPARGEALAAVRALA